MRDASGKWGFIDRTGRFRIPPKYESAGEFSDGVAYVWLWDGRQRKNGIVNADGNFHELPEVNAYDAFFQNGLMRVQTPSGQERRYGYIDKTGRTIIEAQFSDAGHFSEGLAWVSVLRERKWLYGFIDKRGRFAIEPQFIYQPGDFKGGFAKVVGEKYSGFIDKTGTFRIKVDYEQADDSFSEGLVALVEKSRGVYLDTNGKVVLEIPYWQDRTVWQRSLYTLRNQQLGPFAEGLAPVLSFYRIGFIDKTGKTVIAPEFRETRGFSEGLAAVKIIGSEGDYAWGYIDRSGKLTIEPQFKDAKPFRGGLARIITSEGQDQLIDRFGKVIWRSSKV